ncbi:MAG: helix-turn-helix transcriptional regulator [Phycisphaerales bacterium]|nr:helix-turn-helix transcriptional regulator [Phycisphaerales bacterium]MCB9864335.1 helix-turn-helix transcriptional regulator [Phycisphaerales bacterium]
MKRKSRGDDKIPFPPILSTAEWNRVVAARRLTGREAEVAGLVCRGATGRMIMTMLSITAPTLKSHSRSIYKKFGCKNRLGLVLTLIHDHHSASQEVPFDRRESRSHHPRG